MRHIYTAVMLCPTILLNHTIPYCYILGSRIRIPYDRTDFIGSKLFKRILLTLPGCLCGVTPMPVLPAEEISDLPCPARAAWSDRIVRSARLSPSK